MALDNQKHLSDRWLDAAIKQYGDIEPDSGLEQRILRSLTTQPERNKLQQRWLVFATAAAIVLIVGGVCIHKAQHTLGRIATNNPQIKGAEVPRTLPAISAAVPANSTKKRVRHSSAIAVTEAAAQSWPEQFPSPQPLSEQEQLLAKYVREQPRQAQLVARARAELLRQNLAAFEERDHKEKVVPVFE